MKDRRACACRNQCAGLARARNRLCIALFGLTLLLVPAPSASAQDAPPPSDTADIPESPESDPERVTVFAELDEATSAPLGASSTRVDPQQSGMAPATVTELVATAPGVSENGQGGLFQVLSIRGVSRQRVMQLVSGVRITGDRRAGVSNSFIDPLLMGSIEVLQGPSTTFYGSGALGGVVQSFPRKFGASRLEIGYDTNGDQRYVVAGSGGKHWSVGVAHRRGDDAEAADGTRLNSQFEQTSAVIRLDWERGGLSYGLLAVPSYGEDIGKANTDFPRRTTDYPRERHQLFKFSVRSDDEWRFESFVHAHDLETEVFEADVQRARVFNDTVDFGLRWEGQRDLADLTHLRFGFDGLARDSVDAREIRESLDPLNPAPPVIERPLEGGAETEAGAFAVVRGPWGKATWETGLRFSWQDQRNAGVGGADRTALNGFAGITRPVGHHWEVRGSLSSGLRFPSLSELFFSGTTGRGTVVGNPDLNDERALSVEASARWRSQRLLVQGVVYHTRIEDYIDREEIQPDLLTFVNLTSGTIAGLELQVMQLLSESWTLRWGGNLIDGEDSAGRPLADIPTDEAFIGATHRSGNWTYDARLALRDTKDDPGGPSCVAPMPVCSEKIIPSAELLSTSVRYRFSPRWAVSLSAANLLDEDYFRSADRKAPPAPGRSAAIRLIWQAD